MAIEHTFPAGTLPADGATFGIFQPGQTVTSYDTGPRQSRSWFEYPIRSYHWDFVRSAVSESQMQLFEAFLTHTKMAALPFWICEPISCTHPQLVVGPLGDGSTTTFVLPCRSVTSETIYEAAVRKTGSGTEYTLHSVANLLTDAQANAVGSSTGMEAFGNCTISRVASPAADGVTVYKCTPPEATKGLSEMMVQHDGWEREVNKAILQNQERVITRKMKAVRPRKEQ